MESYGFVIIAAAVILFSLFSKKLDGTLVTPPMIFAALGLVLGNAVLGAVDLSFSHHFIHGLAEVTLILVLFSDAARIDLTRVRRDHGLPVRMLLIGMPLIIIAGTVLGLVLPLGLTFWDAALLAAIMAPTDAALGQSVVSSPHVPARIRQALNIESGLNDGIALPLVLLFGAFASVTHSGLEQQNWFLFGAKQVILGPLAGIAIGAAGAWLMDRAAIKGWMTKSYQGPAILGVAFLAYSGSEIIGGNGFIAAFVSGLVYGNWVRDRCAYVFEFAESEGQLLALLTFLIFGAAILPEAADNVSWTAVLYAVLSLTLIRLVPIGLSLTGTGVRLPTIAFLGWFGPRGLASILFALFVLEAIETPAAEEILTVTIVTVALSILVHGLTAAPAAKWYGAFARSIGTCEECVPVTEMPTRNGMVTDTGQA